jgi:hypothetical protein
VAAKSGRSTAAARITITAAGGLFRIPDLPSGSDYLLEASLSGYATVVMSNVDVATGEVTNVNLVLTPATALRESVRVDATSDVVRPGDTTAVTRLSAEYIDSLPILGRNYQDVLTLAPGVTDVNGDGNPNIHGARETDVITLVDGINTTDPVTGKIGMQLNIESIQEIEIKTAAAGAEYSRAQGGFANIITKSGGNQFEGTFKFFWRGSALDGDGAGSDSPALHASIGDQELRELRFNDYLGFLSFSGPIVRDKAWFFVTVETVHKEDPVNALSNLFVTGLRERRTFAKATWQASPGNRIVLSLTSDPQEFLNQGLNSFTREESGYTTRLGGALVTIRDAAVLSPNTALDTTFGLFRGRPGLEPNTGPDSNGNSQLYYDRNGDGFSDARERDGGEDFDGDGRFDVYEDLDRDGKYDPGDDIDGDGLITRDFLCEGVSREDRDCDGRLDKFNEDVNGNGRLDPFEDKDFDNHLDYFEDRNGNGILDDTPYPTSDYPYGRLTPEPTDRDFEIDLVKGTTSGPYHQEVADERRRVTLKQDLDTFVPDFKGSHDIRVGYLLEREQFERDTNAHDLLARRDFGRPICLKRRCLSEEGLPPQVVHAILPATHDVQGQASSQSVGIYVQDTYKPVPSLSLGLGVRVERETVYSNGYTTFDPAAEGAVYRRLNALDGGERGRNDLIFGNGDGVVSSGVAADPWAGSEGSMDPYFVDLVGALGSAAFHRLTGPRTAASFSSPQLQQLLANQGTDEFNRDQLAALGIRFQSPERFAITNNNLSPRLAVAWDPGLTSHTKLFATWGRYYDKLFLSTVVGEEGPDPIQRYYYHDKWGADTDWNVNDGAIHVTPNHHVGAPISRAPASIQQVDRGLRTPFSDELTLGFERELAPEVALSVRYIRRKYQDQLQDVDINHQVRINPLTDEPLDAIGVLQRSPGGSGFRTSDGRPDLFINNFFFNEVLRVGNTNEALYHGVELEMRKRLSRRWELLGSYTYSRAVGAAEDFQSRLGNDPSTVESEFGYLDFDQRHVLKLNFSTFLPHDWQVGLSSSWSSGLPYSVVSRFFALDNADYQQYRTRYGYTVRNGNQLQFAGLSRNSERNKSVLDLNLKLRKNFVVGKQIAAAFLEVFNVLNSDDLTITRYEPDRAQGFDAATFELTNTPFQLEGTRRFGRRIQLGVQFQF